MCNYIPQYNYGSNSNSFLNMTSTLKKDNIEELKNYSENNIQFGTGGIRAKMGLGPGRINEHTILKITQGLANYLIKQKLTGNRIVVHTSYPWAWGPAWPAPCICRIRPLRSASYKRRGGP